jgi:transposase
MVLGPLQNPLQQQPIQVARQTGGQAGRPNRLGGQGIWKVAPLAGPLKKLLQRQPLEVVGGCRVIKGGMKKGDFLEFLRSELCPKLDARKVVIMDNLNIHKSREVEELIRGRGARILYLPVYAPELNPIEMMWSVLKHFIRQLCRIGKYSMEQIVKTSLLLINPSSFRSWFAKCCYCTP